MQKYAGINFIPSEDVQQAAIKGLFLRSKFRRGGTLVGVMRARDLKNRRKLSPRTIRRMLSFFARHEFDKRAVHWGKDDKPSAGYIAWLLWGGDDAWEWAKYIKHQMDQLDSSSGSKD